MSRPFPGAKPQRELSYAPTRISPLILWVHGAKILGNLIENFNFEFLYTFFVLQIFSFDFKRLKYKDKGKEDQPENSLNKFFSLNP